MTFFLRVRRRWKRALPATYRSEIDDACLRHHFSTVPYRRQAEAIASAPRLHTVFPRHSPDLNQAAGFHQQRRKLPCLARAVFVQQLGELRDSIAETILPGFRV